MRIVGMLMLVVVSVFSLYYYRAFIQDASLVVTTDTVSQLKAIRYEAKFLDLPGDYTKIERERNEQNLNELLDRLVLGIERNPSRRWVMLQMSPTIDRMYLEDTEARERFIDYLIAINNLLGIPSTNGAFASKLIFF